ncbi:MAG TPA: HAMP domain-containing sensor histidine kinase, partial [Spirochaetota bacterium]|nr:HAMP domain-containing sensor histidine kinase [Spirochaetota bacterium]
MTLNLKKKILIVSLLVSLGLSFLLGFSLYRFAGDQYYQAFLESKLSLARSIALSIDGSRHAGFTSLAAMNDPDYQRCLKYMNSIRTNENYVSYLFTLNYDRRRDRVSYIVDSDILARDTIWITSEYFGLAFTINDRDLINLKYNEEDYTGDFDIKIVETKTRLQVRNSNEVWIDNKKILTVLSRTPLVIDTGGGLLDIRNRERMLGETIAGKSMQVYCTFSAKGESQSIPGELYMESKDVVARCKKIIEGGTHTIVRRDQQTSIYGMNTSTVYGVIKDSRGVANGLVVFEIFEREVANFKFAMIRIVVIVTVIIFLITLFFSNMLAASLLNPIRKLTDGANRIRGGDLDHTVDLVRDDELGVLAGSFNSMVDTLKRTQKDLTAANAELTRANAMKDEFLANTSHELKTPLNGIIGIAESLVDGAAGPVTDGMAANLRLITLSGKRLAHLVNDILDFSKLKNRDILLEKKPIDMRQIAEMVIILCSHMVGRKPLKLLNRIDPHASPVLGDENRLQQIMYNLVGNAIKFSDAGEVVIAAREAGEELEVTVSDTGIGIPSDRFEDIFRYFEQLDTGAARRYGGTGLGLAITRQLVELHGGTIRVESVPGEGSRFTFSIPLAKQPVKAEEPVKPKSYLDDAAVKLMQSVTVAPAHKEREERASQPKS